MGFEDRTIEKDKREIHLSEGLAEIFGQAYELLDNSLKDIVRNSTKIADIGASDNKVEELIDKNNCGNEVLCLDINPEALKQIEKKEFKSIKIKTICDDGNSFMETPNNVKLDLLIINNTLHELNTPKDQSWYLDKFFKNIPNVLKLEGRIILADHYYDENIPDEEVEASRKEQFEKIKHADERNKFILPNLLKQKIQEYGYDVISYDEVRVTPEINKRYYIFVIKKQEEIPS